ncbi:hypothetical protein NP233_g2776 [Leucocoprinus birnbaumii]|uniref:FAD/NAD(P)-binding domain-containing protein n=1 Tax=Leucocoprinus birnbaumii TaxID=56174 RepID=A0AAD5VXQ1_9AGAR|nr:hypothetical protein NP233_g2776 [Leucocoprinus birnbaumii]
MAPTIGIIGSGPAALITAHTLIKDGFKDVRLITRDSCAGGIWARERVYPGLSLNNVHGELRFSGLEMKLPANSAETGGRLTGEVMSEYMETFAEKFLRGRITYSTEVMKIKRGNDNDGWVIETKDLTTGAIYESRFSKIVLCSGGFSNPYIPTNISPSAAEAVGFKGLILHSSCFNQELPRILSTVNAASPGSDNKAGRVVIIGCGKSAQDIAAYLTNQGRNVAMVYEHLEPYLASPQPKPAFLRRSRRFFHTTWLGLLIITFMFKVISQGGFKAYNIPKDSPLRNVETLFWQPRVNDTGVTRPTSFIGLAAAGKIDLYTPARAVKYGSDGRSIILNDGRRIPADVVILATGYRSSWETLFDDKTAEELGIRRRVLPSSLLRDEWKSYHTLRNSPADHRRGEAPISASSIYRGIVPAKNIHNRDFAINGAILTGNAGYAFEVVSHWISSYFLGDNIRLPPTPEAALAEADRHSAWCEKRFPGVLGKMNESVSAAVHIWSWPQAMDELLEDMRLPSGRSGGKWYNWVFQVIDIKEIAYLTEERRALREAGRL